MKPLTKSLKDIGFLTIALTLALAANFAYGQWSNPPGGAPGGNIAAPINEGSGSQTKNGILGVDTLNALNIRSAVGMRSPQYCDAAGLNCLSYDRLEDSVVNTETGGSSPSGCGSRDHSEIWITSSTACSGDQHTIYQCDNGATKTITTLQTATSLSYGACGGNSGY